SVFVTSDLHTLYSLKKADDALQSQTLRLDLSRVCFPGASPPIREKFHEASHRHYQAVQVG
ncbi:MAG: hypothetical protein J6I30_20070, partial [Pseudomonas sp.]|nr:hypothetical protein [Pseudomonas sp.]